MSTTAQRALCPHDDVQVLRGTAYQKGKCRACGAIVYRAAPAPVPEAPAATGEVTG